MAAIEVWSDSFHEGEWFVEQLLGGRFTIDRKYYAHNFQPRYELSSSGTLEPIEVIVYGDYGSWSERPSCVDALLAIGKPDVMLVDPTRNVVVLAVEETNAVPTGNQALQRLERVWWAAEMKVPFVYLLGEFGLHLDGGLRRNSIWPAYLALKLSLQYRTFSVTAMYGDRSDPNDYTLGLGLAISSELACASLGSMLGQAWASKEAMEEILTRAYIDMGRFIQSQAEEIAPRLPALARLIDPAFVQDIAKAVTES